MRELLSSRPSVSDAHRRISPYISETPILYSEILNAILDAEVYFKAEMLQKTGAFKVRGILNHLLRLREEGNLPKKIVAYSTGNHGIGTAWAARLLGIKARVYLPKDSCRVKQRAAEYYSADVIYTDTRIEAEERSYSDIEEGFYHLHPSEHQWTIEGSGTVCYEALEQLSFAPDAIFASCGGGGLLSGTYLAKEELYPNSKVIGCEPIAANDAFLSRKEGKIFGFTTSPDTVADGLRTLRLSEHTFFYIKKLDDFITAEESEICYWSVWLSHLLKVVSEPSCALSMACAYKWLADRTASKKRILVILSGGNVDPLIHRKLYQKDYLSQEIKPLNSL
jgi:threonine dehydratase